MVRMVRTLIAVGMVSPMLPRVPICTGPTVRRVCCGKGPDGVAGKADDMRHQTRIGDADADAKQPQDHHAGGPAAQLQAVAEHRVGGVLVGVAGYEVSQEAPLICVNGGPTVPGLAGAGRGHGLGATGPTLPPR